MNSFFASLTAYCEDHSTPPDPVLYELERETHLKTLSPQMISGHLQGRLLEFISLMLQPLSILEIGTFTGYATICLARGLQEGGMLHTIEANPELKWIIDKYVAKAGLTEKVTLHVGDAKAIIPALPKSFDLIFIDAAKQDNALFYEMCLSKLRPGGFLLVDNVLWSGKVIQPVQDADTRLISAFNAMVRQDDRVENLVLPVRDGLLLVRRKQAG